MSENGVPKAVGLDIGTMKHSCSVCGKSVRTACGLSNHMRVHTGQSKTVAAKISQSRRDSGVAAGPNNPNFGAKNRPWLEGDRNPLRQWHKSNPDFAQLQTGLNNPVHKVRHLYDQPEYVDNITRGLSRHTDAIRGSDYNTYYGKSKADAYRLKLRAASPSRLSKFTRKETAPERMVREVLECHSILHVPQYPFGYYTVDFFLPEHQLVIQTDGDYWHGNPLWYGDGGGRKPLTDRQRHRQRLDKSCDSFLSSIGIKVLRLWETDLKESFDQCLISILQSVQESP